ncbi:endonuclease domain-containing protein [Psychroflexus sp. CAK8W]|uniref:Endonuclease domain-containing protein n=1 Tax=Psychroflexus longus TaxID=2873596 RepID=A0ABS7XNJ2_9FLAO|nr:endonuclease domain-containing protein [Psychroflexus longus]MBZ9779436.1 endonuclease domain-containing protein [Psychroflexus longus]
MKDNLYHDESMHKGAKPDLFDKAKLLRETTTESETKLWKLLRKKDALGYRFRRQHPFGHYILDFYNHELKLCIEIDGGYHQSVDQKARDKDRDKFIDFNDVTVLRFTNDEVNNGIEKVLEKIRKHIVKVKPFTL